MTQLHLIISPTKQMLFHTELFLETFTKNSGIENFQVNLTVGPQHYDDPGIFSKICGGNPFIIKQYYKSQHNFHPPYLGGIQRWDVDTNEEVSLFADVDMIVCNPIKDAIESCKETQKVLGVRNTGSPFRKMKVKSMEMWNKIEKIFNISFNYIQHHGVNISQFDENHFLVPDNYFNYGFIVVPKIYRNPICESLPSIIKRTVENLGNNFWTGEIALCVALKMLQIPTAEIEIKYNYPDRLEFFQKVPCNDIRILHMMQKTLKTRDDLMNLIQSKNQMHAFMRRVLHRNFKLFL